jgi:hypothetical protein
VGLIALVSLPREEEPQISVPLVDIHVEAHGLRAEDAVKLVTEPLETIVKGIDDVEHVYSDTRDDRGDGHRALRGRHLRRHRDPAGARQDPRQYRPHPGGHPRAAGRRARDRRRGHRGAHLLPIAGAGR